MAAQTQRTAGRAMIPPDRRMSWCGRFTLPDEWPDFEHYTGKASVDCAPMGRPMLRRVHQACEAAALESKEVTPYVLRHTWATWFNRQTKDFGGRARFGGWQKGGYGAALSQRLRRGISAAGYAAEVGISRC